MVLKMDIWEILGFVSGWIVKWFLAGAALAAGYYWANLLL